MGPAAQAPVQEVPAGESGQPLGGTAKRVEEVGRVAGTMDPATRGATTTVTPGAITLTKMTGNYTNAVKGNYVPHVILILCLTDHLYCYRLGLIPGLMRPSRSRAGVPTVEMEMKAGVTAEMAPEQGAAATGGSPKKVPAQLAGTATVTGPALDVGASQAEPTPAAATPG